MGDAALTSVLACACSLLSRLLRPTSTMLLSLSTSVRPPRASIVEYLSYPDCTAISRPCPEDCETAPRRSGSRTMVVIEELVGRRLMRSVCGAAVQCCLRWESKAETRQGAAADAPAPAPARTQRLAAEVQLGSIPARVEAVHVLEHWAIAFQLQAAVSAATSRGCLLPWA